jgi:hypothetical protein
LDKVATLAGAVVATLAGRGLAPGGFGSGLLWCSSRPFACTGFVCTHTFVAGVNLGAEGVVFAVDASAWADRSLM